MRLWSQEVKALQDLSCPGTTGHSACSETASIRLPRALCTLCLSEALIKATALGKQEGVHLARKAAANWADSQDRIALLKREDAPASAQSHEEAAFIGRCIARAIQNLAAKSKGNGMEGRKRFGDT